MANRHEIRSLQTLAETMVVETVDIATIRAQSLSNLDRWNANCVWVSAHDEWRVLMAHGSDADVIAAILTFQEVKSYFFIGEPPLDP